MGNIIGITRRCTLVCLVSWRLLDGWMLYWRYWFSVTQTLTWNCIHRSENSISRSLEFAVCIEDYLMENICGSVTYMSWSSDSVLNLEDYLMDECWTGDTQGASIRLLRTHFYLIPEMASTAEICRHFGLLFHNKSSLKQHAIIETACMSICEYKKGTTCLMYHVSLVCVQFDFTKWCSKPNHFSSDICVDPVLQISVCEPIYFQNIIFFPNNRRKTQSG